VIVPTIAPEADIVEKLVVPPVRAIAGLLFGLVGLA
jgi:hypothetical protein